VSEIWGSCHFKAWLDDMPERKLLKNRIKAIKQEHIGEIKIAHPEKIEARFFILNKVLKPRHQRDIGRLLALVKSLALLNWQWRQREGQTITANDQDIEEAFKIWDRICIPQELNLPPYIYKIYQEVIAPLWEARIIVPGVNQKEGISRHEIIQTHFKVYGRMLDNEQLRQQILPMLETAGLIFQELHPTDKRKLLTYPTAQTIIPEPDAKAQNNNSSIGGIDLKLSELFEDSI
jgi:hypothetical protein